ncbi:DNA-3-methyladenine glycosylase 2 family protein [Nocardia farcinica]|uniref:DNA-3-methyladenine glycosylase II n=2 Tax=Nocardia TaxID=1817 RepID=A0A449H3A5_NOCFR|nr:MULTISPECIES: Ada metal-binding domain-containing protein [Nocardia]MBF6187691.1 DNA-3-methyladenine glycosylase 2 family protein [Nocardia farcinica]MBF6259970.1 DNA-3-methyladenine glycosylase 2 family protein [Nocardia farcinica]MBF6264315.1 DNA-3-methyladenine glycosylase 2 family protein [Nocardia farcinica]MBF6282535.1 DNA-3-methyladenine glycosylase 2 family protein [Nocardia farcinica]MBF6307655.1 DNA-3-methyladenine glycosylase 2 family protein [Nocardia farcinica]
MDCVTITALDFERCYRAVSTRDSRFDGQFFTAVRTTGIYCRPSCPAITPKRANVTFLPTAAAAQQAGYRACRRCLPDAAPGSPLWNTRADLAARAMRLIGDGVIERGGVPALAAALGYSQRQLTRVLTTELGAGPLALARAHRAHTARLLIQTTDMPMSDVAFAAGFASIRQFNDTVREVFAVSPTVMRAEAKRSRRSAPATNGTLTLRLPFREPLDRAWLEWFLSAHAAPGMESWADGTYTRALRTPHGHAIVRLGFGDDHVRAQLALHDMRDLAPTVARVRHLLDLDADPMGIDEVLGVAPGIRVPGCLEPAELLLRTMIGQQISVGAAATHTARLVAALGEPVDGAALRLFPTAATLAEHGADVLTGPARRVRSIVRAADAVASGELALHQGRTATDLRADLLALDGVGPWTADYVTMRLLADPDILLSTDLVVRQGADLLGLDLTDTARWAPWRSYLSMHLWKTALAARVPGRRAG